ncbi:MAG: ribosome maturation factor RimM [Lachnospiraceae bacterium]|nr:ribosome maturation factor RimM [Lachnospiraceae bacterium]
MRNKQKLLSVGQITSTHGLKGEVKVYPTTDDPEVRFKQLKEVILKTPKEEIPVTVRSVRFSKNLALLKFEGIDGIDAVEKYKGAYICVPRDQAQKLGPDEYYEADLIGMEVVSDEGMKLGILSRVMHTGANDVYEIDPEKEDSKSFLIPAIKECIKEVDVDSGLMTIHVMEGLL